MRIDDYHKQVELGASVVMPNHVHMIINIKTLDGVNDVKKIHEFSLPYIQQRRKMIISKIVGKFKMITSKQINITKNTPKQKNWQANYHDHIIRNDSSYNRIVNYIRDNPSNWKVEKIHEFSLP